MEQNLIFQMDMVFQIIHHLFGQSVQTGPAAASAFGKLKIIGQFFQARDGLIVVFVFMHHHADGHGRAATHTLINHREQHALLFHHVHQQLVLHIGQQIRHFGRESIGMNLRHFLRQRYQLFKLGAVDIVVTLQDMVDGGIERCGFPKGKVGRGCVPLKIDIG